MCKHLIKIRPNPATSSHTPADLGLEAERWAGATRTGGQTRTIQWYTTTHMHSVRALSVQAISDVYSHSAVKRLRSRFPTWISAL